ncbi:MAG TPA: imidazolonepropionase [Nevskiaceae bacterium]|nr:imidazolonepropionase [Nevskiaceae bacterium]
MQAADLLIYNAAQLLTCAWPTAKRGAAMTDVGLIEDAAIAIGGEKIIQIGKSAELCRHFKADNEIDARGKVICPGLVDPHTHVVFAGDRIGEFERRIRGESYQDIAASGGGIVSTVSATRAATLAQIVIESSRRLDRMLALGTTTAEAKTGYGLDADSELKLLLATEALDKNHAIDLVPTFLGAHAVPPEFRGRGDDYIDLLLAEMLPAAAEWYRQSRFAAQRVPMFVDVFCEQHAFTLAQSRRVLEAAQALGLPLKAHVDEFSQLGALDMALGLGAVSVDHLDETDGDGIARLAASNSIGVIIPTVNFHLGATRYANARAMLDAGCALALTTDINPGSAPCPSLPMAMAIACRYQKLAPAEALNACTINAAYAVGLGERTGSLQAGRQADLILLDATDWRVLAYEFGGNAVARVVKRGRIVV